MYSTFEVAGISTTKRSRGLADPGRLSRVL
jgi:hypothetical protein